ncbi:MAG: hypothetical protein Q9181_004879 [Wetmoreana brouardii]
MDFAEKRPRLAEKEKQKLDVKTKQLKCVGDGFWVKGDKKRVGDFVFRGSTAPRQHVISQTDSIKMPQKKPPQEWRDRQLEGFVHSPVGSSIDSIDEDDYVRLNENINEARWAGDQTKYIPPTPYESAKQSLKHSYNSIKTEPLTVENLQRHTVPLVRDLGAFCADSRKNASAYARRALHEARFLTMNTKDNSHDANKGPYFSDGGDHDYDPMGCSGTFKRPAHFQEQIDKIDEIKKAWNKKENRHCTDTKPNAVPVNTKHMALTAVSKAKFDQADDVFEDVPLEQPEDPDLLEELLPRDLQALPALQVNQIAKSQLVSCDLASTNLLATARFDFKHSGRDERVKTLV